MLSRLLWIVAALGVLVGCNEQYRVSHMNRYWTEAVVFEVGADPALREALSPDGRMFVILRPQQEDAEDDEAETEPETLPDLVFAVEVEDWSLDLRVTVGEEALGYPVVSLLEVEEGSYLVQPFFSVDPVFSSFNAPGGFFGPAVELELATGFGLPVHRLVLDGRLPPESPETDTDQVQLVSVHSELLSAFWERSVELRAAVILPRGYDQDPERRYPVRYHRGGHGCRPSEALELMAEGSAFRSMWLGDDTPRMLLVILDGRGPFGDSRHVDSDCNGPYATATVTELIPHIESQFRAVGAPEGRFLDGDSATGGWSALALQVFFPDAFNGVWAACADSVDFRALGLIDIYEDDNAYFNQWDLLRPCSREADGEPRSTVSMELWKEGVLGRGDSFLSSGGVWASRHAAYGPRAEDGTPRPLWDPETGDIDREVAEQWQRFDLRTVIESRWAELGPQLQGKLRLWMGDKDSAYNDTAMHLLALSLQSLDEPRPDARITFGPGQADCWRPVTEAELMGEMVERYRASVRSREDASEGDGE